jgi:hypothetical protein
MNNRFTSLKNILYSAGRSASVHGLFGRMAEAKTLSDRLPVIDMFMEAQLLYQSYQRGNFHQDNDMFKGMLIGFQLNFVLTKVLNATGMPNEIALTWASSIVASSCFMLGKIAEHCERRAEGVERRPAPGALR